MNQPTTYQITTQNNTQSSSESLWQRQPNEPPKWYSRFEIYLSLGPERNVHMTYEKVRQERSSPPTGRWAPPAGAYNAWKKAANTWGWRERADAWDTYNRTKLAMRDEQRRIEERELRINLITQQLRHVESALLAAQLEGLSASEARGLLPTLRLLLRDMLDQQRIDLEPLVLYNKPEEATLIPFCADELVAAMRELETSPSWGLGTIGAPAHA